MFWVALGLVSIAAVFFQMGTYSVWISAAKGFVSLALLLCGAWIVFWLWRRVFPRKLQTSSGQHAHRKDMTDGILHPAQWK